MYSYGSFSFCLLFLLQEALRHRTHPANVTTLCVLKKFGHVAISVLPICVMTICCLIQVHRVILIMSFSTMRAIIAQKILLVHLL